MLPESSKMLVRASLPTDGAEALHTVTEVV